MTEAVYTIDDLAEMAGESRRTIERRIKEGRIPVIRRSARCVRIRESAANAYLYGEQKPGWEGGSVIHLPTTQGGTS